MRRNVEKFLVLRIFAKLTLGSSSETRFGAISSFVFLLDHHCRVMWSWTVGIGWESLFSENTERQQQADRPCFLRGEESFWICFELVHDKLERNKMSAVTEIDWKYGNGTRLRASRPFRIQWLCLWGFACTFSSCSQVD